MATEPALRLALDDFIVIPRHLGTWKGEWFINDASGILQDRFSGLIWSRIIDNRLFNELRQYHSDGSVQLQRFVGVARGPGRMELISMTPAMTGFRLLAREIDETRFMVELSEKETGLLRGVEFVTLLSPSERVRTMQAIRPDGTFSGTMNIIESRVPRAAQGARESQSRSSSAP